MESTGQQRVNAKKYFQQQIYSHHQILCFNTGFMFSVLIKLYFFSSVVLDGEAAFAKRC